MPARSPDGSQGGGKGRQEYIPRGLRRHTRVLALRGRSHYANGPDKIQRYICEWIFSLQSAIGPPSFPIRSIESLSVGDHFSLLRPPCKNCPSLMISFISPPYSLVVGFSRLRPFLTGAFNSKGDRMSPGQIALWLRQELFIALGVWWEERQMQHRSVFPWILKR